MTETKPELRIGDEGYLLPVVESTIGDVGLDVRTLRGDTGYVTFDPGYANTASTESAITYIDGGNGTLWHRGYRIEDLAEQCGFLEVAYLLLFGELPDTVALEGWRAKVRHHTLLNEELKRFFDAFPRSAHPMAILSSATNAISTFYEPYYNPKDPEAVRESATRLIAKMPTVAAWAYKKSIGQPYVYPRNDLSYVENFLHMMFALPVEEEKIDPIIAKALNVLLILHADHGQNCSTATVRFVGSSQANLFASVAAGMNALWGPLHGGANQEVVEMLDAIHVDRDMTVEKAIARAKDKDDPYRLMGFGHRIYRNYDPRARILKRFADDVLGTVEQGRPAARDRPPTGDGGARGRLLRQPEAVSQRRLLLGADLPGTGLPHPDVHGALRHRTPARMDRQLDGDARARRQQDRPAPADLHRPVALRDFVPLDQR